MFSTVSLQLDGSCISTKDVTPATVGIAKQVVSKLSLRTNPSTSLKDVTLRQFPDAKIWIFNGI